MYTELGIKTCNDLLNFFPFRYIDKTQFYAIKELQPNSSEVQIVGKITRVQLVKQKRGSRLVATFQVASGQYANFRSYMRNVTYMIIECSFNRISAQ
jgi:ATP-dependent DNA helicase RecG